MFGKCGWFSLSLLLYGLKCPERFLTQFSFLTHFCDPVAQILIAWVCKLKFLVLLMYLSKEIISQNRLDKTWLVLSSKLFRIFRRMKWKRIGEVERNRPQSRKEKAWRPVGLPANCVTTGFGNYSDRIQWQHICNEPGTVLMTKQVLCKFHKWLWGKGGGPSHTLSWSPK